MKKTFVYALAGALLVSSCGSYTASGAYTGSMLGSVLGSAIGGLSDGPRGSDWGSILGMAGGAVVGAAVGSAADRAHEERIERKRAEVRERIDQRVSSQQNRYEGANYGSTRGYDGDYNYGQLNRSSAPAYGSSGTAAGSGSDAGSGYDPSNSGDDRFEFESGSGNGAGTVTTSVSARDLSSSVRSVDSPSGILIQNVRFDDANNNLRLEPDEVVRLVFEVRNCTSRTLYDIRPHVEEVTGAKNVYVSPDARVESLAPGKGIRYTAMIKGGHRLKDGSIVLRVNASQGNGSLSSNVEEISIPTVR